MNIKKYFSSLVDLIKTRRLFPFVKQHPYSYFTMVIAVACMGYLYLLLFPVLAIIGLWALQVTAQQQVSAEMLSECLLWLALMVISIAITHHIVSMRFAPPKGVLLKAEQVPKLFALIHKYTQSKLSARIQHVIITEHFELDIRKTPVSGYPVWSHNSLVIGLPLLQCLSEEQFAHALQRRCLQLKLDRHLLGNWMFHLSGVWPRYANAFRARHRLGDQLIAWFFQIYASAYQRFSVYVAQQTELNLESAALAHINDGDLFKTIQTEAVSRYFYNKVYLPKIEQATASGVAAPVSVKPYAGLPSALKKVMTEKRIAQWLAILAQQPEGNREPVPSLIQRMENIGHSRIKPPQLVTISAAKSLFGPAYPAIVQTIDKFWLKHTNQRKTVAAHTRQPTVRPSVQLGSVA